MHSGTVGFLVGSTAFKNLHIPMEILKFWYVHRFIDFVHIAELLYFQREALHFGTFTDSSHLSLTIVVINILQKHE